MLPVGTHGALIRACLMSKDYTDYDICNPKSHFVKVSQGIFQLKISSHAKILLMVLIGFKNNNKSGVHPSLRYLAKQINVKCRKSVMKPLKELRDAGMIEWEQKHHNGANHYYFDSYNKSRIREKRLRKTGGESSHRRGVNVPTYKDITLYRNNIIPIKK